MTTRGILEYNFFLSSKTYLKRLSKSIITGHLFIIKVKTEVLHYEKYNIQQFANECNSSNVGSNVIYSHFN